MLRPDRAEVTVVIPGGQRLRAPPSDPRAPIPRPLPEVSDERMVRVTSLGELIAAAGPGAVEVDVFETVDPWDIASTLAAIASTGTGVEVREGIFYQASAAAVAGLLLDDDREVVVHAYRRDATLEFVEGVARVQGQLAAAGFPCARPFSGPLRDGGVIGRVETLRPDPGPRRFAPHEMRASAHGLAWMISLAEGLDPTGLDAHPMALPDAHLYPRPHSPLFDFAATAAGAEWVDELAIAARDRMTDDHRVVAHGDWSARNVRLGPEGMVCVYDWESLQHCPESTAVGIAAATWRSVGAPGEPLAPSDPEIRQYVEQYELARGHPFTSEDRNSAYAAAVYALAYTARCEHALVPGTTAGRASGRLAAGVGLRPLLGDTARAPDC